MGPETHSGGVHFPDFQRGQPVLAFVDKAGNDEKGGCITILSKDRKGIVIIILIGVIEGDQDRISREAEHPPRPDKLLKSTQGNRFIAILLQFRQVRGKPLRCNRQRIGGVTDPVIQNNGNDLMPFPADMLKGVPKHSASVNEMIKRTERKMLQSEHPLSAVPILTGRITRPLLF